MTVKLGCGICDARWEIGTLRPCACNDNNVNYSGRLRVDATTGGFRMGPLSDGIQHSERMSVSSDNTLRVTGFAAEREKVARWMMERGYATGHGDTTEELLNELEWQVKERAREACAQLVVDLDGGLEWVAKKIRARNNQ